MSIEIQNVSKTFNKFNALNNINLHIPTGELVALLGPSGCGKTTLLRIIAGLEFADSGSIFFYGEDTTARSVRDRQVGFVFQHYALFRHMTVFENVAFGLRMKPRAQRPSDKQIQSKVDDLLNLVQMQGLADRFPRQLSGGQRQRIALARALAVEPKVLLLDEPFGALDTKVRKELRRWLRHLHDTVHITSVFVTHDQEEAMEVSDRVVVMNKGNVEQVGTPDELYENAVNPFVYQFLGNVNVFKGHLDQDAHFHTNDDNRVASATAYVRPHDLEISRIADGESIAATVLSVLSLGATVRVELLDVQDITLEAELSKESSRTLNLKKGEQVFVKSKQMRVFTESGAVVAA